VVGVPPVRVPALSTGLAAPAFAAFVALAVAAGKGGALHLLFTPAALAVGALLYRLDPPRFLGFCLWLWMLTPLVRRLVDWQSAYHVVSPVMLAPVLVTGIAGISLVTSWRRLEHSSTYVFSGTLLVLAYGYFMGVIQSGLSAATFALASWVAPVLLGFHLAADRHRAPENARALFQTLAWGALVMGAYGVWQYFDPPPWDRLWMLNAEMNSIGLPLPREIRVFSTMNSPGPFAIAMMACLLALLNARGPVRWLAPLPGYVAFMLSLVRAAWGGWVVGALVLLLLAPARQKIRHAALAAVLVASSLPLLALEPISGTVTKRLESLADVERDESFADRQDFYADFARIAFTTLAGTGLGATGLATRLSSDDGGLGELGNFDSGIMDICLTFGLPATMVLLFLLATSLGGVLTAARQSPSATVSVSIAAATAAQLVFINVLTGPAAMFFFPLLGLAIGLRGAPVPAPAAPLAPRPPAPFRPATGRWPWRRAAT
jgi:hypothetical protein